QDRSFVRMIVCNPNNRRIVCDGWSFRFPRSCLLVRRARQISNRAAPGRRKRALTAVPECRQRAAEGGAGATRSDEGAEDVGRRTGQAPGTACKGGASAAQC